MRARVFRWVAGVPAKCPLSLVAVRQPGALLHHRLRFLAAHGAESRLRGGASGEGRGVRALHPHLRQRACRWGDAWECTCRGVTQGSVRDGGMGGSTVADVESVSASVGCVPCDGVGAMGAELRLLCQGLAQRRVGVPCAVMRLCAPVA
jgi:hypothetical protein